MKKMNMTIILTVMTAAVLSAGTIGSSSVDVDKFYSLEDMFRYAMEDEHMALAEYEAIMEKFDVDRPYANIAKSEETHISYLNKLYETYGFDIPRIDTDAHVVIPSSLAEAAQVGVDAEIANIAMYEKFLDQDLPDDVREVFTFLKNGSENHLASFQRQLAAGGGGRFRSRA
ncbi:ferritin-like domain-containing protein [Spirochaeta isovalerica]|uniref:DUF2202 domain-containing protein n=1 Tax=Spirochaeta isovalerica TaxID=150 RepID=A0A841R9K0_9SPIO|nr:DUF2202 domain-containing protein [Spirochaeta isovalerica]MBB6480041.1 hypothetical protein [Spirochaeta isovalerica]